jgi:hypothetical protein
MVQLARLPSVGYRAGPRGPQVAPPLIHRRAFLAGSSAAIAVAALPVSEPIISGLIWQSCPFGAPYPAEFISGQIGPNVPMPLSWWLAKMERHRWKWPALYWREFRNPDHNGVVEV